MGLGRKSREQFEVISVQDDAIDRHSAAGKRALEAYVGERDPAKLVLVPGGKPVRFWCRPLAHDAAMHLEGMTANRTTRDALAFACSVERIEGLEFEWSRVTDKTGWGGDYICDESMKPLIENIGLACIREIGSLVIQKASLTGNQKKAFSLPLGCAVDWGIGTPATDPNGETG
jgi:hypothetical protein